MYNKNNDIYSGCSGGYKPFRYTISDSGDLYCGSEFDNNKISILETLIAYHKYNSQDCEPIFSDKQSIDTEENNMSIASAMITNDGIILISDSRSTKNNAVATNSYKKIVYLKQFNCGVVSTGLNEFGGKTLEDYINDEVVNYVKRNPQSQIEDFITDFKESALQYIRPSGLYTDFRFVFYQNKPWGPSPVIVIVSYPVNPFEANINFVTQPYILSSSGRLWTLKLFDNYKPLIQDSKNELKQLTEIYQSIIDLDNKSQTQSTIGGKVQSLIISP